MYGLAGGFFLSGSGRKGEDMYNMFVSFLDVFGGDIMDMLDEYNGMVVKGISAYLKDEHSYKDDLAYRTAYSIVLAANDKWADYLQRKGLERCQS